MNRVEAVRLISRQTRDKVSCTSFTHDLSFSVLQRSPLLQYAANYDFTNKKSEGTTVQSVHQGEVAAGNGIQVLQDIKVQYGDPRTPRATHDANSEEWIMQDHA
jgi:hypothetical protein